MVGVCGAPDPGETQDDKNKPSGELTTHRLQRVEIRLSLWASHRATVEQLRLSKLKHWETVETVRTDSTRKLGTGSV